MSFPQYREYKQCGLDWAAEIPAHWEKVSLKRFIDLQSGEMIASDEVGETGPYPVYGGNGLRGFTEAYTHDGEFALVGRQGALCGNVKYVTGRFWASEHALVATPTEPIDVKWLSHLLTAMNLNQYSMSAAQPGLSTDVLRNLRAVLPPEDEQKAVAQFLERETAKIDALVTEQDWLVELLAETRVARIFDAVTGRVDSPFDASDSSAEWFGEVPHHWSVVKLRRVLTSIEQGWSPECLSRAAEWNEWGVLKAGCLNGGTFQQNDNKALPPNLEPRPELEVRAGDILVSRASGSPELVGSAAYVATVRPKLMLSDKIFRLHSTGAVEPRFLAIVFNSAPIRAQIERDLSGASGLANNLPQGAIRSFFVPLPPNPVQRAIVSSVESEMNAIADFATAATEAIRLLRERRAALITAAVTGQIDVRGLVEPEAA